MAQLGAPDMRMPLLYALAGERHWTSAPSRLDLPPAGRAALRGAGPGAFPLPAAGARSAGESRGHGDHHPERGQRGGGGGPAGRSPRLCRHCPRDRRGARGASVGAGRRPRGRPGRGRRARRVAETRHRGPHGVHRARRRTETQLADDPRGLRADPGPRGHRPRAGALPVCKWSGIYVKTFSIGIGPKILRQRLGRDRVRPVASCPSAAT